VKDLFLCNGQSLSLVVLAGGTSRRMQCDKALLPAPKGTLIEHILNQLEERFDEVLISVSNAENFVFLKRTLVIDEKPGEGPMMGIKTALQASRNEKNFVIACDIPNIHIGFLTKLILDAKKVDIALPVSPGGRLEPLFAVYSKTIFPLMEELLEKGIFSLLPLFERCKVRYVQMRESTWFKNLNTPREYEAFLKRESECVSK
jgi:molybdopterin-guanine dinucleotide biosynthesis protein A